MSVSHWVDRVKTHLDKYDTELNLHQIDLLNQAHAKTGQKRIYLVLGAVALIITASAAIFGLAFLSNLVAFYPLYQSFKALRTPQVDDDKQWLTYWIVYATLGLFESLIDSFFFWLPFYFIAKIVFLIWCFHPNSKGALVVYQRVLGPLFVGVQSQ